MRCEVQIRITFWWN